MHYEVNMQNPGSRLLHIRFTMDKLSQSEVTVKLPSWRPGRYEMGNFARNITSFQVKNSKGEALPFRKSSKDSWKIQLEDSDSIIIDYAYYASQPDAGACWVDEDLVYFNPVHCFLYIDERMHEPCNLVLRLPVHFQVATALEKKGEHAYAASDYHEMVDSPVLAAEHIHHHEYDVDQYHFNIWLYGICQPDWPKLVNDFRKFSTEQIRLFHDLPVTTYHFLILVLPYKFYHGVEHAKSTVLAIGPGSSIMSASLYADLVGVAAHELFHVWNVKSIRPNEMNPYNYSKENYSRLGFVYEGITTYYGDLALCRCGVYSVEQFFSELSVRIQKHFDNYGRFNLSVADASFDTWLDGYVPGAPNRKVSIYDEGCLVALMTDLLIRRKTNNEKSLDDVMRMLYFDFGKKKIGYTEHDFISLVENLTNESAADFFIDYVYGTEDYKPMLEELLGHFGCELRNSPSPNASDRLFGFKVTEGAKVLAVAPGSPAFIAGLAKDDEIIAVDGNKAEGNFQELLKHSEAVVTLTVSTPMKKIKSVVLIAGTDKYYPAYSLVKIENTTTSQQKNQSEWLRSVAKQSYSFMN